jgi:flagellar protein FlaG
VVIDTIPPTQGRGPSGEGIKATAPSNAVRPHGGVSDLLPDQLVAVGKAGGDPGGGNSIREIELTAETLNDYMKMSETHLQFHVLQQTGRVVIQVVDDESMEVIRQIPPETVVRFAQTMAQLRGLLFETQG